MRKLLYLFLLPFIFLSCSNDEDEDFDVSTVYHYINPSYPVNKEQLRILVLGNSFTLDATTYLQDMVNAAGIDNNKICLYEGYFEGASFYTWSNAIEKNYNIVLDKKVGLLYMESRGDMKDIINQEWDLVIIQQVSSLSYKWSSYKDLSPLLINILQNCPNKNLCIAVQMPWVHNRSEMPFVLNKNFECCTAMTNTFGLDLVIPTGTAIQLARNTSLEDGNYLTRDDWHLNEGMGRYIAACTWFEKIICPVFGGTILNNAAKPMGDYSEEAIKLGQECAVKAVASPYSL